MNRIGNLSSGPRSGNTSFKHRLIAKHTFCHWCYKLLSKNTATIDHIIPLKEGGPDQIGNVCLACDRCNNQRGQVTEFIRRLRDVSIDAPSFKKLYKRYLELQELLKKWNPIHEKHCPEMFEPVDEIMNELARSV
jgi:HNH endonuclease